MAMASQRAVKAGLAAPLDLQRHIMCNLNQAGWADTRLIQGKPRAHPRRSARDNEADPVEAVIDAHPAIGQGWQRFIGERGE